jgi:hypothetical protein
MLGKRKQPATVTMGACLFAVPMKPPSTATTVVVKGGGDEKKQKRSASTNDRKRTTTKPDDGCPRQCGSAQRPVYQKDTECFECPACHAVAGNVLVTEDIATRLVDRQGNAIAILPDAPTSSLDDADDDERAAEVEEQEDPTSMVAWTPTIAMTETPGDATAAATFRNFVSTRERPPLPGDIATDCMHLWHSLRQHGNVQHAERTHAVLLECACRRRGLSRPRLEICAYFAPFNPLTFSRKMRATRTTLESKMSLDYDHVKATLGLLDLYLLRWWHNAQVIDADDRVSMLQHQRIVHAEHIQVLAPLRKAAAVLVTQYYASAQALQQRSATGMSGAGTDGKTTGVPRPSLAVKDATVAAACLLEATLQSKVNRVAAGAPILNRNFITTAMDVSLKAINTGIARLQAAIAATTLATTTDDVKKRRASVGHRKSHASLLSVPLHIVRATSVPMDTSPG